MVVRCSELAAAGSKLGVTGLYDDWSRDVESRDLLRTESEVFLFLALFGVSSFISLRERTPSFGSLSMSLEEVVVPNALCIFLEMQQKCLSIQR